MAKLHFKYGAMNSGKSTALINTAYNYTERGLSVVTVKPAIDTKGEDTIVARAGLSLKVDILATPETNVREAIGLHIARKAIAPLHCVLVDESQFLKPEQVDQLYEVAKSDETSVIAYGLRTDFLTNLFEGSMRLMALADNIEKLPTMCRCGSQAEFNCRKIDGGFVFAGSQVAIDGKKQGEGEISYDSLCGTCYYEERSKAEKYNSITHRKDVQ